MRILGIDPGVERTGFALFDSTTEKRALFVFSGIIKTPKSFVHEKRLYQILLKIEEVINRYKPTVIVLEKLFMFKNQKTVIQVAQAQGATLICGAKYTIPVVFLTPLEIKTIVTGYGRSDKQSVQKMMKLSLQLPIKNRLDDEWDAIATAYAYCCINTSFK